ncbi:Phosphoesterase HXTX [Nitratifractor salsuginis DSM 16511]|uniref:Phosphoesterase HXTX n=2 Tax=Nitratifractor salsuginis TaxID=269261 RepID=E6X2J7_NITSE|nr:Phosphoesterase HXTX [Nitratifractor salsuginis DSM 16511]
MRLFIASPVLIYNYTQLRQDFSAVLKGRWVEENALHLTWIFLGDQPAAEPWRKKLRHLTALEAPIPLQGLGSFGRPPRVFHLKAHDPLLYKKAREMKNNGLEPYRFTPHVTLCRIEKIVNWREYKKLLEKYREEILGEILPEIALYESTLCKGGSIYRKIESIV